MTKLPEAVTNSVWRGQTGRSCQPERTPRGENFSGHFEAVGVKEYLSSRGLTQPSLFIRYARIRSRAGKGERLNVMETGQASCPENSTEDGKNPECLRVPRSASRGKNEDGR